jgi:hypothetical protein
LVYKDTIRKILSDKNWLEKEKNKSQTLNRITAEANKDIDDLAVLTQALPSKTLENIFNLKNIGKLINAVLAQESIDETRNKKPISIDEIRKLELAVYMVNVGLEACIISYTSRIEFSPVFNKLIIEQFLKTRDICNEILIKMKLLESSIPIDKKQSDKMIEIKVDLEKMRPFFDLFIEKHKDQLTLKNKETEGTIEK